MYGQYEVFEFLLREGATVRNSSTLVVTLQAAGEERLTVHRAGRPMLDIFTYSKAYPGWNETNI
jgi:hypothetical protein